jgi:hypothetical protein
MEVFDESSHDAQRALVRAWQERNGAAWDNGAFPEGVDGFRGFVRYIWRNDPLGPSTPLSLADAIAKASAFVTKNADLLGFSKRDLEEMTAVEPTVVPPSPGPYHDYQYFVRFSGTLPLPRYEAFPSVTSHASLDIGIHSDGEIRAVLQNGGDGELTSHHPDLDISTIPGLGAQDPAVLAGVVGTPLARYDVVGHQGYQTIYKKTDLGPAEASDATAVDLTILMTENDNADKRTYRLAYAVTIAKAKDTFAFVVDAVSGEVLQAPEAPFGIIR